MIDNLMRKPRLPGLVCRSPSRFLWFLGGLMAVLSPCLFADGIGLVPAQSVVYEYAQTAIIRFAGDTEDLSIAAEFNGTSDHLAWLIPLPAAPEVDSVGNDMFYQMEVFCAPIYRYSNGLSCGSGTCMDALGDTSGGVHEIGGGIIGNYSWQVLEAFQPDTLVNYLLENGYALPAGTRDAFQHYLDQNWCYFFVAQVVDTNYYYYWPGVRLRFASDSIVYPLYISRLASQNTLVTLYVLADHRQMYKGGMLRFSGKAGPDDIPGLADREYRLTELTRTFSPSDMQDLTLRQAPDDQDYREIVYSGGVVPLSLGLVFGVALITSRRRRKRRASGR